MSPGAILEAGAHLGERLECGAEVTQGGRHFAQVPHGTPRCVMRLEEKVSLLEGVGGLGRQARLTDRLVGATHLQIASGQGQMGGADDRQEPCRPSLLQDSLEVLAQTRGPPPGPASELRLTEWPLPDLELQLEPPMRPRRCLIAFTLVVAPVLVRRQSLAILLALIVGILIDGVEETSLQGVRVGIVFAGLWSGIAIAVLLRFGLVALIVVAALAAYGYWAASAGGSLIHEEGT